MKHIIFDLDGTLTDSGKGVINSVLYAFEKLGIEAPKGSELRKFVGPPLTESFRTHGIPAEKVNDAIALYRERYVNGGGKYENEVYDGIEGLLKALKEEGYKLYVGTSKPEELSKDILAHFGIDSYFDIIAGASLDLTRETKTQVLEYLLKQIETEEENPVMIMVGDTKYDVIGANDLSIPCVGVTWGYGTDSDMQNAGAVSIAASCEELFAILKKW
ncbi:MAG: HAD hydrolase-like protein [Lachnospiraceae bacterium]|nr:HAD hydrolase-like protein [Lachnospiraceae bacterium]